MGNCSEASYWLALYQHNIPYAVILLIFSPVAIFFNITLLASFIATKQTTQNTSNIIICALSISDLMSGALTMPFMAGILLDVNLGDRCIQLKMWYCFAFNGYYSVFLTALLAMNRYLHMNPDFRNRSSRMRRVLEKPNVYCVIVITALISLSSFVIGGLEINEYLTLAITNTFITLTSLYVLIIAILYIRGYLRIRKFTDTNPVYNQSVGSANATPDYVRRLYKTVFVLISLATIQYFPTCLVHIVSMTLSYEIQAINGSEILIYFFELATLLSTAGSFLNCIAVLYFNRQAKRWILSKIGVKNGSDEMS